MLLKLNLQKKDYFQIINGYHRCRALARLGFKTADCVVWDVDDEQTDVLLATLNRLGGSDELGKKLVLLKRLNKAMGGAEELARLVPQTAKQIERLTRLKRPVLSQGPSCAVTTEPRVFFLDDEQRRIVTEALKKAGDKEEEKNRRAVRNAAALAEISRYFLDNAGHGLRPQPKSETLNPKS